MPNPPRPDHSRLLETALRQHGYFTAAQAASHGYRAAILSHHVRRGALLRLRRGSYRFPGFPDSRAAEIMAAWFVLGAPDAFISHGSALELHGLHVPEPHPVHLTVPRARRWLATRPGVILHTTTREPQPGELVRVGDVPVSSPARALLDFAALCPAAPALSFVVGNWSVPEPLVNLVCQALGLGLCGLMQRATLTAAAATRGRRVSRLIHRALVAATLRTRGRNHHPIRDHHPARDPLRWREPEGQPARAGRGETQAIRRETHAGRGEAHAIRGPGAAAGIVRSHSSQT